MELAADDQIRERCCPMEGNHVRQLLTQCIAAPELRLLGLLDAGGFHGLAGFFGTLGGLCGGACLALPLLGRFLCLAGGFGGGKGLGLTCGGTLALFAGLLFSF
jgi:hypothetical protein